MKNTSVSIIADTKHNCRNKNMPFTVFRHFACLKLDGTAKEWKRSLEERLSD